jgi:hypothetical protein
MDYEIGFSLDGHRYGHYPIQRNRTLFVTSIVPVVGEVDTFRVWYGAADANVATAILKITHAEEEEGPVPLPAPASDTQYIIFAVLGGIACVALVGVGYSYTVGKRGGDNETPLLR